MNSEKIDPREKIILATIDCIGREGIQSLTIRKIASEAGVNSAAINYYFGTKDRLVELALAQTMDEMSGLPGEFLTPKRELTKKDLEEFLNAVLEGVIHYPGITKAHLYGPMMENDYSSPFPRRFNAFVEESLARLKGQKISPPDVDLRMILIQLVSAVVFPCLIPDMFGEQFDFYDPKVRRKYVSLLAEIYFGRENSPPPYL